MLSTLCCYVGKFPVYYYGILIQKMHKKSISPASALEIEQQIKNRKQQTSIITRDIFLCKPI